MRYTTLIDIRGTKAYASPSVRLLYLHMVLVSGYHAEDLDQVRVSIRGLAEQTGLSVSAVRHGLKVLAQLKLVSREGDHLRVAKYVVQDGIPKRARTKKEQQLQNEARQREQQEHERERQRFHEVQKAIADSSVQELEKYLDEMKAARPNGNYYIRGVRLTNNDAARAAIAAAIESKKASK